jgi:hypothetical protein
MMFSIETSLVFRIYVTLAWNKWIAPMGGKLIILPIYLPSFPPNVFVVLGATLIDDRNFGFVPKWDYRCRQLVKLITTPHSWIFFPSIYWG